MSEEKLDNAVETTTKDTKGVESPLGGSGQPSPKKPRKFTKKTGIIIAVVAAVVLIAGGGFYIWHEQPSFCNAICHNMDDHGSTYAYAAGEPGVDKWGNTVDDAADMLVVAHREYADATCMSCHTPVLAEQVNEGLHWVAGSYSYPLDEKSLTDLNGYQQHETPEGFCLNEDCHNITRDELALTTSSMERNPHVTEYKHQEYQCSDCHKAHRQSVMVCSRCHDDATVPDGWLSAEEAAQLQEMSTG